MPPRGSQAGRSRTDHYNIDFMHDITKAWHSLNASGMAKHASCVKIAKEDPQRTVALAISHTNGLRHIEPFKKIPAGGIVPLKFAI